MPHGAERGAVSLLHEAKMPDQDAPSLDALLAKKINSGNLPGRRGLMRQAGIGAALLGGLSLGLPKSAQADTPAVLTDDDILNFALNLEYLEAEFYLRAVYGMGLSEADSTGLGQLGETVGGHAVPFTDKYIHGYAKEIANDELNHVRFLRSALGSATVAKPAIDLKTSFTKLFQAAGIIGPTQTFNPFKSDKSFLLGAYIFEDVGVTAYHGAAAAITSKTILTAAVGIGLVEAYHASEVRLLLLQNDLAGPTQQISALRAALSGADDDQGITLNGESNIVPTDTSSIAFARTPDQVLNIVYGGGAANGYLFFPHMLNGHIQ